MATKNSQRIGILIIAFVMTVGTIGSFVVMILANDNAKRDQDSANAKMEEAQKKYNEYQEKVNKQGDELSAKYYEEFKQYASQVGEFDRDGVKEIKTEDLKAGDGDEIKDDTKFAAYYIGWNPKGKVFDQSIDTEANKLKPPLPVENGLEAAGLIEGWKEGMKGMKVGGVRVITIPSDKAYGEQGQGDEIPPNTPIKFVVMAIPKPDTIPEPDLSEYYGG